MDDFFIRHLEDIKNSLICFGWWPAKAGKTIFKSDVVLAVDCIELWHSEIEQALLQDEKGREIHSMLLKWIQNARLCLKKEPQTDFEAIWEIGSLPDINMITIKIDTLIFQRTGNISTFFQFPNKEIKK